MIYIDKEGSWFHNGAPIIHREILQLFYQHLGLDQHGNYVIEFKNQVCRLDVEDTPFVVMRTDFVCGSNNEGTDGFMLHLIDNTKEVLAPETLSIGPEHVLYCRVRGGRFSARFSRPGYYQLAQHIRQGSAP